MFFTVSKIIGYFLNPFAWIFILLLLPLFWKNPKKKRHFYLYTLLVFILFSNPFIGDEVLRLWELPHHNIYRQDNKLAQLIETDEASTELMSKFNKQEKKLAVGAAMPSPKIIYNAGILLCGDIADYDKKNDRLIFRSGADRLLQTIDLYKNGVIKKIVITGGSGHLIFRDRTEAAFIKLYLVKIGIDSDDILIESSSRNTYENAKFTSALLKDSGLKGRLLLITSALHMKRASATFKKSGLVIDEYPTSKITGDRVKNVVNILVPSITTLHNWDLLIHEVLGFIIYKILGYC